MIMFTISQNFKHMPTQEEIQMKAFATAVLAEITELRTSVTGITAQLDADAGVTDTDYASSNDPAAITIEA